MVHVMQPNDDFGSSLGRSLGTLLGGGASQYFGEQQRQQQQSQLQQSLQEAEQLFSDPNLSPEQKQIGLFRVLSARPEIAEALGKQLQQTGKPAALNKFSPLPPELQKAEQEFLEDKTIQDLPDEQWYAEGVRRNLPPAEMDRLTKTRAERKKGEKETEKIDRETALMHHKEWADYDKQLRDSSERAKKQLASVSDVRNAMKKNPTGALTAQNVFKKFFAGTPLENIALSPEGAIVEASVPQFIEGFKDVFGVRLTDRDVNIISGKLIDLGKSPEANEAILTLFEKSAKLAQKRYKVAQDIKEKNKGLRTAAYDSDIDKEFDRRYGKEMDKVISDFTGFVKMYTPDGEEISVPKDKVGLALEKKATYEPPGR